MTKKIIIELSFASNIWLPYGMERKDRFLSDFRREK